MTRASTFLTTRSFAGRSADVPSERTHRELNVIPVIASQSILLMRLFDAAVDVPADVTLHHRNQPVAIDTLRAWAASRSLTVEDVYIDGPGIETPYMNLHCKFTEWGPRIAVLKYRDATAEEIERERTVLP